MKVLTDQQNSGWHKKPVAFCRKLKGLGFFVQMLLSDTRVPAIQLAYEQHNY